MRIDALASRGCDGPASRGGDLYLEIVAESLRHRRATRAFLGRRPGPSMDGGTPSGARPHNYKDHDRARAKAKRRETPRGTVPPVGPSQTTVTGAFSGPSVGVGGTDRCISLAWQRWACKRRRGLLIGGRCTASLRHRRATRAFLGRCPGPSMDGGTLLRVPGLTTARIMKGHGQRQSAVRRPRGALPAFGPTPHFGHEGIPRAGCGGG